MICIVIKGPSYEEAKHQLARAKELADIVELRLDYFDSLNLDALKRLSEGYALPIIFTLRSQSQGGAYQLSEEERLQDIQRLAHLNPAYFDLECDLSPPFIARIKQKHPKMKIIISSHHFENTPENLEEVLEKLKSIPGDYHKLATMAHSGLDAARMLLLSKRNAGHLIALCMGEPGAITRILGPVCGSFLTYATLEDDQKSAPGQLKADVLKRVYHYPSLNPHTALYGLIGKPVTTSISEITHNTVYHTMHQNAVYFKVELNTEELGPFLARAKALQIRGLSVTMPYKEAIIPYLDHLDPDARKIGAVNTLVFQNSGIYGYNTDGLGALNAIESSQKVKGQRIVVLGAGGAAKAIVYEGMRRGAQVVVLNRHPERARQIAEEFDCSWGSLNSISEWTKKGYEILINCTPVPLPILPEHIQPDCLVMDIKTRPMETELLAAAKERRCKIVYGYQMFVNQAVEQFRLWTKELDSEKVSSILTQAAREYLYP